ncbi:MinD/ParA family ATP-binding protein [Mycolicibacterium monacense]|uniref:ATPase n=4 Tax=Mycobacteriaceae TaxID=1762 RepID=A0AAD1IYM6_MYCMB|nr:MinD/ParA family protein [Mycolicibacterium monacense]MDA4104527.1 ATPase involved in chromosome partitioning family protein [Mycolicibacterium monacense DSM 44395]BBZ63356.1 ATPase [Mycolicibacterium monacense]
MTDRDDALRRELGWTGQEDEDFEPDTGPSGLRATPPPPPVPDPERRTSFRDPQQSRPGPPPAPPRPQPTNWGQPPGWQPARGPLPPAGTPPQQSRPPEGYGPESYGPGGPMAQPGSYADWIRVDELVPPRRTPPAHGWRRWVYRLSFGRINPGQSPEELRQLELENKVRGVLRGHYKVGVMGKGGVGKTTVSASIGSVFAELRQDDRVVAIDADTAFGKLGSRVDPNAQGSYWELASDQHLESFADVRSRVGNNAAGLFVLAGEGSPARRRVLDPAIYREAASRLDRYFSISIVDCSSTMDSPVTQEVLRDLDALIVVSSPWVDGAAAAGQTLDWLAARGMTGLLQRTVVVLNDSDGHADKRTRSILAQQFAGHGQRVIEIPFDGHLRPGGVISGTREMSPAARRKFLELAAALADHFPSTDDRSRERG